MRIQNLIPIFISCLLVSVPLNAQQSAPTAPRDPQSVTLLQRSLVALVGTTTVSDVTLTGTANSIAGSDNETGAATLKATAIGQSRVDLSLSNSQRSEVRDISAAPPTGSWSGPDGTFHPMAAHNLFTDPAWFFPAFLISRVLSNPRYAVMPADEETKEDFAVEHITVYEKATHASQSASLAESLSRTDIYLNASTLIPVAVSFVMHADNDALINIPTEIRFSNYQDTQGVSVPYRIQKYVDNGLVLDLVLQTVQFNSGLVASEFTAR